MESKSRNQFTFNISLSVLNHLGRNLYRSFVTVLGEAISNSWDADAKNVWIQIDKKKNSFTIKDDGVGMTSTDFHRKKRYRQVGTPVMCREDNSNLENKIHGICRRTD